MSNARSRWHRWFRYTLPGAWFAVVFACLAFTPSLLPRSGAVQGAVCGISAAIGYGVGVTLAWVWRAFADREERPARRTPWRVFTVAAPLLLVASWLAGRRWQGQVRDLMGVAPDSVVSNLLLPVFAVVLFVLLVAAGRGLRRLYRFAARQLRRWIGPRAAAMVGWVLVVGGMYYLVSGVLLEHATEVVNQSFSLANGDNKPGVVQPTSTLRSGGPGSLVPFDSLGREGRAFVSYGPTAADISKYSGKPAQEPIRVFAGLESADTTEERAQLAVDDLERAGGFDRTYLMIATTTGSGWVSPGGVDSFEYLVDGDSAIVAMQYSYLPSWISYLVDQDKARDAGRTLYDAVYERWAKLPADHRPKLIIFGESLGSFGAEAAFSGEYDLANRTSGALLTGPPNFNTLYREFVDNRDPGTLEVAPTYRNGRIVRFDGSDGSTPVQPVGQPWAGTRILYRFHASDPIVWWSPNLILHRPDWLAEAPGDDVVKQMVWIPFVTFWQVTADLPLATAVPAGHGHAYDTDYVDAWAEVLRTPGWTQERRDQLQAIINP